VRTNYSPEWVGRYILRNYLAVDPVAQAGYTVEHPTSWSDLDWSSREANEFRDDASSFGIGMHGLLVPIIDSKQRRSIANFSSNLTKAEWEQKLDFFKEIFVDCAEVLHIKAIEHLYPNQDDAPKLSPRELQCLGFAAKGLDAGGMARELNLSEHTVRDYCKSARLKLDCINLAQAVHKATILRLISPNFRN